MICRVKKPHTTTYPEPFLARKGERLAFERKPTEWKGWIWCTSKSGLSAWVPESWVTVEGESCILAKDYNSIELNVEVGEQVVPQLYESGWVWVRNSRGESGWVPEDCLEKLMTHLLWYPGHELLLDDIVRAENCYIYDSRGNRYVDLESGVWCTPIGHTNPRILRAIAEQSARICHMGFNYSNEVVEGAAQEFLSLLGFEEGKCVFLCSGSEAVEYGVRVAQMIADRPRLMTMTDSYFGAYGSASRKEAGEWFCFDWAPCAACPGSEECSKSCEYWAAIPFEKIGGFLLEPGSSSGLVRFPPEKLIRNIGNTVQENGGLILVNEVTTGIGRTGAWFGYQHYQISPDIVAIGKGVGNGYPVSVTVFGPRVINRLRGAPVMYAQSHQNDAVGAVAAREVIRIIREERLIERSVKIADDLMAGLEGIRARTGRIKEIRGRGLMVALELEDDSEASFTISTHRELVRRGFILGRRPGVNVLRLDPPLTIAQKDIESFLETLEAVLTESKREG